MELACSTLFFCLGFWLMKRIRPIAAALISSIRERAFPPAALFSVLLLILTILTGSFFAAGVWFLLPEDRSKEIDEISLFISAIDASNEASRAINKGQAYSVMNEKDAREMMSGYKSALSYAERVNIDFLNSKFPKWGEHFEQEFIKGHRLVIAGNEKVDAATSVSGQKLLQAWGKWLNENVNEIRRLD